MVMKFNGLNTTIVKNAKTDDIINALVAAVPLAVKQFKNANTTIYTGDVIKDAIAACMYVRDRVKYKADGFDFQDIQLPGRMFYDTKQADCKSFSLSAISNLLSKGYRGGFRFASYKPNKIPTHVYIFVLDKSGKKFTFDPCIADLKESKRHTYIKDMEVRYLSGLSEPYYIGAKCSKNMPLPKVKNSKEALDWIKSQNCSPVLVGFLTGRFKREQNINFGSGSFVETVTAVGRDLAAGVASVAAAPARIAFLTLVSGNAFNYAKKLDRAIQKDVKKVRQFWYQIGGDFNKLQEAVNKGKDKKPFLSGIEQNCDNCDTPYISEPLLAAAGGIIIALANLLKSLGVEEKELTIPPVVADAIKDTPPFLPPGNNNFVVRDPDPGANYQPPPGTLLPTTGFKPSPLLIGGIVGGAVLIYILTSKKK